jgi:protein-disulfide isomerase
MKRIAILSALIIALAAMFGCAQSPINEGMAPDGRAYRGSANPKVTIYEYSDFECPYCGRAQSGIENILRSYPDVRLEFRHFPLPIHIDAFPSAVAGVCAEKQGNFWKMHDMMYANQKSLNRTYLESYANQTGLDMQAFDLCMDSSEASDTVRADMQAGISAGVHATPSFVVGQSFVEGADTEKLRQAIELELSRK